MRQIGAAWCVAAILAGSLWLDTASAVTNAVSTVSVTGTAVGWIPNDVVIWTLTMEATDKDILRAKEKSEERVKTLTELFRQKGVLNTDMVVGFTQMKDAEGGGGVTVTRTVTVRQRDLSKFTQTLEALPQAGRMQMKYAVGSSKRAEITRETMNKAVEAAKDKAAAMASVAGAKLGRPLTISEYPPPGWNVSPETLIVDVPSTAFGADTERIMITIYATFELE